VDRNINYTNLCVTDCRFCAFYRRPKDDEAYVLADYSGTYSPAEWAMKAVHAFKTWQADRIIAEGNQGGEMVKHTLQTHDRTVPVSIVHASRGKVARAEPIAALFEQNRAHIAGQLVTLEDQLCTWEPLSGDGSPDRLDAMVWALTHCMVGDRGVSSGKIVNAY
jgi:phage terminase large subunit-like protein